MSRAVRLCLLLVCLCAWAQEPSKDELKKLSEVLPSINAHAWNDAETKLKDDLVQFPHSALLMNALGIVYDHQGKTSEAIQALQQAIDWLPSFTAAQLHLASLLAATGSCDRAVHLFVAASRRTNDPGAVNASGLGLAQCKSYAEAATALKKAHSLNPASPATTFNLALAQYENGDFQSGLNSLAELPAGEDATRPDVLFLRGKLMDGLKMPEAAAQMASACRTRPEEDFCDDAAIAFIRSDHFREASDLLEGSRPKLDSSPAVLCTLGLAQFRLGRYHESVASYSQAIRLDPKMSAAREGLAFLLYMNGDLEPALAAVDQGSEVSGNNYYLQYLRALILYRQGRSLWPESLLSIKRSIELEPEFAPSYYIRGKIMMEQGSLDAALEDFKIATRLDPKYALPYYKMGQIYQRQGLVKEAEGARLQFTNLGSRREEEVLSAQAQKRLLATH